MKKQLKAVAAMSMAAVMMTGCGGGAAQSTTAAPEADKNDAATEEAKDTSAEASGDWEWLLIG